MLVVRLCVIVMLLAGPLAAQAQFRGGPPGGFGGFGGPFGGGGFSSDPTRTFEFLARGRSFFLISETRSLRDPLTQYAKEKGITNEQITKEHFIAFSEQMKTKMAAPGSSGSPPSFGKGPPSATPSPPGSTPASPGPASTAPSPDFMAQMADSDFKRRDRNGDGRLNTDEMSDTLRGNLDQFDKNKDNVVDFEEYKAYFAFRMLNRDGDRGSNNNSSSRTPERVDPVTILIMEDYDVKPVVIRAGKLPKELPKWFSELDADEDGQVAMYEWRKGGKNLDEFIEWDRNEDGFVTPEEVLRKMNLASGEGGSNAGSGQSQTKTSGSSGSGGPSRFGGFGGGERPSFGGGPPGSGSNGNGGRPPFGGFGGFGKKKGSN